jgi:hypothetical protein
LISSAGFSSERLVPVEPFDTHRRFSKQENLGSRFFVALLITKPKPFRNWFGTMKKHLALFSALIFILATPLASFGFHLGDHVLITRQTLQEFEKCYPGLLRDDEPFFLLSSNLDEDLNVIRKDLVYSHFYNPNKKLEMFRYDSSVRIQDLAKELATQKNSMQLFIDLGHVLHHVQDMASPAHVVPVFHGPSDTFEVYELKSHRFATQLSCRQLEELALQTQNLPTLLKKAAQDSLQVLAQLSVPLQRIDAAGSTTYPVYGNSFWQVTPGNDFGVYGPLGRHFGETEIQFKDAKAVMPLEFYEDFKNRQMQMAVINSWIALYQLHQPQSTNAAHKFSVKNVNPWTVLEMETFQQLAKLFAF